ncbi:acyl-CoA carboxylase epsilon subunit [Streptomyces sp. NPDC093109]|uniref:acyl-CoA carboxylase epsilon subunit n=1 Tax=Streptomyces sp. NPDC093109 TaxID=3154977 RepID=UPI00344B9CF0
MSTESLLRIERGHAEPEELAALMAVLLARAAANTDARPADGRSTDGRPAIGPGGAGTRGVARWHRREYAGGFGAPSSWRNAA